MSDFVQQVQQSIRERRLFRRRQSILVAVSGGLDSMVLLHVLHRLAPEHGWQLTVAHFNHQLRGRSSEADEKFVRQTAECLELPFVADRGDVKQLAARQKLSVEMAARQLRHDFFARAARESGVQTIALAHHADDQVELFFLRLLRGAGPDGLAGMRWSGPSPTDAKLKLVRPLLGCAKEELQRFAICEKILFREDATNATVDFLRNRVRHELLPLLASRYQSALSKTTLRLMDLLEAESKFVGTQAEAWLHQKRRSNFGELPLALQRRVLQLQLFQMGAEAGFDLIERLRTAPEAPVTLKPHLSIYRDKTGTVRAQKLVQAKFDARQMPIDLEGENRRIEFDGLKISWEIQRSAKSSFRLPKPASHCEWFDAGKLKSPVLIRHWRPGDRFQPIGMAHAVKLQDLFANLKIPRAQRHQLVVAEAGGEDLFWVEGLRISDRFKLEQKTTRRLKWRWFRKPAEG